MAYSELENVYYLQLIYASHRNWYFRPLNIDPPYRIAVGAIECMLFV